MEDTGPSQSTATTPQAVEQVGTSHPKDSQREKPTRQLAVREGRRNHLGARSENEAILVRDLGQRRETPLSLSVQVRTAAGSTNAGGFGRAGMGIMSTQDFGSCMEGPNSKLKPGHK